MGEGTPAPSVPRVAHVKHRLGERLVASHRPGAMPRAHIRVVARHVLVEHAKASVGTEHEGVDAGARRKAGAAAARRAIRRERSSACPWRARAPGRPMGAVRALSDVDVAALPAPWPAWPRRSSPSPALAATPHPIPAAGARGRQATPGAAESAAPGPAGVPAGLFSTSPARWSVRYPHSVPPARIVRFRAAPRSIPCTRSPSPSGCSPS